jgi:hypothetical protein
VAKQNFTAWLRNGMQSYGIGGETMVRAASLGLSRMPSSKGDLAKWLERAVLERWPERATARSLLETAGIGKAHLSPWFLLNMAASKAIGYTIKES